MTSPVLIQACEAAWTDLEKNPHRIFKDVAIEHGLSPHTFHKWIARWKPGVIQAIRARRGLPLISRRGVSA